MGLRGPKKKGAGNTRDHSEGLPLVARLEDGKEGLAPEPPQTLSKAARREWSRLAPALHGQGRLSCLDLDAFGGYCEVLAEFSALTAVIQEEGWTVSTFDGGRKIHPLLRQRNEVHKLLLRYQREFGLTPLGRAEDMQRRKEDPNDLQAFLLHAAAVRSRSREKVGNKTGGEPPFSSDNVRSE